MREPDDFPPTWFLLRPLPGWGGVPASIRMKRALKCLLRSFGIKNEGMRSPPPDDVPVADRQGQAAKKRQE
jgi:hypothetical protein